jgi:hypothetical protein
MFGYAFMYRMLGVVSGDRRLRGCLLDMFAGRQARGHLTGGPRWPLPGSPTMMT